VKTLFPQAASDGLKYAARVSWNISVRLESYLFDADEPSAPAVDDEFKMNSSALTMSGQYGVPPA
jgi:hypothetical protein